MKAWAATLFSMQLEILKDATSCGQAAARYGVEALRAALKVKGSASVIVATGASQFDTLSALTQADLPWHRITFFHLDEYLGLPITHPASFRRYLWQRLVTRLPLPPAAFHFIDGEAEPQGECNRLADLILKHEVDVAFIGIGENGHVAFNDPPADFAAKHPYLVVNLDDVCRRQQLGEGWFGSIEEVPSQAISMSVPQIMRSQTIICTVPDERKAEAVKATITGPVTPLVPASILQNHPRCKVFLDRASASLLSP